jgi:protein TonB
MKKQLTILFFLVQSFAFGQVDTVYFNDAWLKSTKEKAVYYRIITEKENAFYVSDYFLNSNKIQMTGKYLDKKLETRDGAFIYYDSLGNTTQLANYIAGKRYGESFQNYMNTTKTYTKSTYENNKLKSFYTYHKNGKLKREEIYEDDDRIKAECFDSLGNKVDFYEYDIPAEYDGGLIALRNFLSQNITYPTNAVDMGIEGKCYIKFIIDSNGVVSEVKVLRGVFDCPECDAEAVRVVKLMKDWSPAMIDGQKVNSCFSLPVQFKLDSDEPLKKKKWWQFWKRS